MERCPATNAPQVPGFAASAPTFDRCRDCRAFEAIGDPTVHQGAKSALCRAVRQARARQRGRLSFSWTGGPQDSCATVRRNAAHWSGHGPVFGSPAGLLGDFVNIQQVPGWHLPPGVPAQTEGDPAALEKFRHRVRDRLGVIARSVPRKF